MLVFYTRELSSAHETDTVQTYSTNLLDHCLTIFG